MRSYEFAPGRAWARADRPEATFPKPCPHRRRRYRDVQPFELTDDAWISPAWIFSRETQYQLPNLLANWWPAGTTGRRPSLGDQAPMPPEQRGQRDEERSPACARQQVARRRH